MSPELLIQHAIDRQVPVETMEKLLTMRRELRAEAARTAFFSALSSFQSECPTIKKTKQVFNKDGRTVRYAYAPLESIVEQVSPLLKQHGFSYTLNSRLTDKGVEAICTAHHIDGHSETFNFAVPVDNDAYMSPAQQSASALTFASRYAFRNAFGILTGDQDTDGAKLPTDPQNPPPTATVPRRAYRVDKEKRQFEAKPKKAFEEWTDGEKIEHLLKQIGHWPQTATEVFRQFKLIGEAEQFGSIKPEAVKGWSKEKFQSLVAEVKSQAEQANNMPGGDKAQAPEPQGPPLADGWRDLKIHFGQNNGIRLGDIDKKKLFGWCMNWEAEPNPNTGEISAADHLLREALDEAKAELYDKK